MSDINLFDQNGQSIAYIVGDRDIYSWNGRPLGLITPYGLYNTQGQHVGWFADGWVRDRAGNAVLFSPDARGGPLKPVRQVSPVKGVRQVMPVKGAAQVAPARPMLSLTWSQIPFEDLF